MTSEIRLAVVIPVFNDWDSATKLVDHLCNQLSRDERVRDVEIVLVDDGSTSDIPEVTELPSHGLKARIIPLSLNVGHQRAIMVGLLSLVGSRYTHVIVMDSDGEDTPAGLSQFLDIVQRQPVAIVVAQRGLRSENWSFRAMYRAHKLLFRLLVGKKLDFGNFALLPKSAVERISSLVDTSSHLASAILRSGLPLVRLKVNRGARYFGKSQMNFEKLVAHSFASLAVFSDQIMVRLMILSFFSTSVTFAGITIVIATRFLSAIVTPGWATAAVGLLAVLSVQILSFVGLGTLISLNLTSLKNFVRHQTDSPPAERSYRPGSG
jgi:glycosyltransferase involved in cell wall biosynthesis